MRTVLMAGLAHAGIVPTPWFIRMQALTPALAHWRRRLTSITTNFEVNKEQVQQLQAASDQLSAQQQQVPPHCGLAICP